MRHQPGEAKAKSDVIYVNSRKSLEPKMKETVASGGSGGNDIGSGISF